MNELLLSNIIPEENLRKVQTNVLENISNAIMKTAGPYGSNTMIIRQKAFATYSKDGKKVLDNIKYYGPLENAIVDELSQMTSYVVKEVGDGTTSAIRMAYYIFKTLLEREGDSWAEYPTHTIISSFKKVTKAIQDKIASHGRDLTLGDIYDICMVSTNGDENISKSIAEIYNKYGASVNIDVGTSNSDEHKIKEYDGLILEKGYPSNAYINTKTGHCIIKDANIYYFKDPIDTPEMASFLQAIIANNIIVPIQNRKTEPVPTVIMCPHISRDVEALLDEIETMLYSYKAEFDKPPILIISGLNRYTEELDDICRLCGAKPIMKYIDPNIQKHDIECGKAPTPENIYTWCGHAEVVDCDSTKTKFINPENMYTYNEDGTKEETDTYRGLINFLEDQLKSAQENNEDISVIRRIKKRLMSLNANMVQYLIGGISTSDVESAKDLTEDAVLNCRSACQNGIGYGANFEGLRASYEILTSEDESFDDIDKEMIEVIHTAYKNFSVELYSTAMMASKAEEEVVKSIENSQPMNLRTLEYDGKVLSSINTDSVILEGISRIITIMFTSNQGLTGEPLENKYAKLSDIDMADKN